MTDKKQEQEQSFDFDERSDVEALVARFGGLRPCAAQLGLAVGTVQGWKKRGSIPPPHQQKIRDLLSTLSAQEQAITQKRQTQEGQAQEGQAQEETQAKTQEETKEERIEEPKKEEEQSKEQGKKQGKKDAEVATGEEAATEEGIVSAFTSSGDSTSGDEEGLDISSEVWEHAALPRSTSGQWAILISLIALVGVVTRPLWAAPIDTKLMGALDDGHTTASPATSPSSAGDAESEGAHDPSDKTEGREAAASDGSASSAGGAVALPRDLLVRLEGLERDMATVSGQQSTPAAAELRRLKSESDALAAAFDNQSARLDSLVGLLQQRSEALSRLRAQVERLEQNRATERLSRRLNALFQLENIAYAIVQRSAFSLEPLESSLSLEERAQTEGALALLTQANDMSSPQQLLADYRRLLPDLLVWQAMGTAEQDAQEQGVAQGDGKGDGQGDGQGFAKGFVERFAQKLRAQLFGIVSLRRRYGERSGDKESALFQVERMLEEGRLQQAEERLAQTSPSRVQAREQLGEEVAAQLEAFRTALSVRNNVFAALHDIRDILSSGETGDLKTRAPSF